MDLPIKALSIRQPWAWAIVHAGKDIENRDWATKFRGPVCIHAAKGMTRDEYESAMYFIEKVVGIGVSDGLLQRGGIIGVATISDCVMLSNSPWFMGSYGFVLSDVQAVDFIPVKGALGFFDWRANMEPIE